MAKLTAETKVGILVSLGLLILAAMIVYFGQFDRYFAERSGYEVKALFNFVGGVQEGAPVNLAGVEVGQVKHITINYGPPTRVQLSLWLKPGVRLTRGAEAIISNSDIMGDKYVEIMPGSQDEVLKPGSIIEGKDPVRLEKVVQMGEKVIRQLGEVVESVQSIVGDKENREALRQTLKNTQVASKNLEVLTGNLNQVLGENRETLRQTIKSTEDVTKNLEVLTGGLGRMLGENRKDIEAIIKNFRELSGTLKTFSQELEDHPTILFWGKRKSRKKNTATDKQGRRRW